MKKKKNEERMLPSDYTKYLKVKETEKELEKQKGFFTFPEELKGNQEIGERPFLVFYFDDEKEYKAVRRAFELHGTGARSHPDLDAHKLFKYVKKVQKYLRKRKKTL